MAVFPQEHIKNISPGFRAVKRIGPYPNISLVASMRSE
jgi:hypothetical protein